MARAHLIDPNAEESALEPRQTTQGGDTQRQNTLSSNAEDVLLGDDIPEQYRGKKARDMLQIAQNQQSLIGRQSQEVGQLREETRRLREMVDRSLAHSLPGADDRTAQPKPLTKEDFWDKPDEVVPRVLNDGLREDRKRLAQLEYNQRRAQFNSTYQTAAQDVNDPDFVAFVERSPRRQRLANRAFKDLQNIDFDAAEELWESWGEFRELKASVGGDDREPEDKQPKNQPDTTQAQRRQSPPPAVRGGGGGGDPDQTHTQASGRQWTETELLDMQEKDADRYWALAASGEIDRAWREGRVKRQGM